MFSWCYPVVRCPCAGLLPTPYSLTVGVTKTHIAAKCQVIAAIFSIFEPAEVNLKCEGQKYYFSFKLRQLAADFSYHKLNNSMK